MSAHPLVAACLLALLGVTGAATWAGVWPGPVGVASDSWWWIVGAYGIPILLAGVLLGRQRWTLMAAVVYATIGLAFDIATVVQVPYELDDSPLVAAAAARGLCNVAVIAFGWRGFLSDWPLPSSSA